MMNTCLIFLFLTSEERFELTLNHKKSNRLLIDFVSTYFAEIHVLSIVNLRKYYGFKNKLVRITDPYQMLGKVDQELLK